MTPTYWMCECTDPACGFRFPAPGDDERGRTCPLCGAPTCWEAFPGPSRAPSPGHGLRADVHLVLDNLRSSYNVGSLFRTADGAGVTHLYPCGITPRPGHPGVAKTALGAQQSVSWSWHSNGLALVHELRAAGRAVWALETHPDARSLFAMPTPGEAVALVIGNELAGVDPAILEASHQIVALPMAGKKSSLNAASAGAIAAYWLCLGEAPRGCQDRRLQG